MMKAWRVMLSCLGKRIGFTWALGWMAHSAMAEVPKLEAIFPAGGQIGSSFVVTAVGKTGTEVRLWTESPGVYFVPTGRNQEWQATVTAEAVPGLYLLRAVNEDGASEPRWFSLGSFPEIVETEPNDELGKAQAVAKCPVCINGRLDKGGDMDGYSVRLEAGQTLSGLVEAYSLGSGVDMLAHVVDEKGVRVLTASDGRNLDPSFVFKAPAAGFYTVQLAGFAHPPIADVRFIGGAAMVYRLHLQLGPVVTHLSPPAITLKAETEVNLAGQGLDGPQTHYRFKADQARTMGRLVQMTPPKALRPLQGVMTEQAPVNEKEPNETSDRATMMPGGYATGVIQNKGDIDRFRVEMKKGQKLQARLWAKQLGLPLDATIAIEAPDGKVITISDDVSEQNRDPLVAWTAAMDGPHQVVVEDLFHQGSSMHAYVLQVQAPPPELQAELVDVKNLLLEAGKIVTTKVKVKRLNGFKAPSVLRISGLPSGVFASEVAVPEKDGEVEIKLQAAANAPASGQPIQIEVWNKDDAPVMQPVLGALRGENQRGTSLLDTASQIWLTVKPKRP